MPLFANLDEEEKKILMHKLGSCKRKREEEVLAYDSVSKELETELSKVSEEENFNVKNRYRL